MAGGTAPNQGPVPGKGWRKPDGTLMGDDPALGGVYAQTLPWPQNGTVFAEGNVRVSGTTPATGALQSPCSLTVVSMGNIYIEGSLGAGTRKVFLLARQNVVLNPTGTMARVEAQTRVKAGSGSSALRVEDAQSFRVGDYVSVVDATAATGTVGRSLRVAGVSGDTLTFGSGVTLTATETVAGSVVRAVSDASPVAGHSRLQSFRDVIQRRFRPDGTIGAFNGSRIALKHSGERKTGSIIAVDNDPSTPDPDSARLAFKRVANVDPATSIIRQGSDKKLAIEHMTAGATDTDTVAEGPLYGASNTDPNVFNLDALRYAIEAKRPNDNDPLTPLWYYTPSVGPNYDNSFYSTGTGGQPPYFFLASVGNRFNVGQGGTMEWRPSILRAAYPSGYEVPMATSVLLSQPGARDPLGNIRSDRYNSSLGDFERVAQLGFNPVHGYDYPATAGSLPGWEDIATVDQSFYSASNSDGYTLDSRVIEGGPAPGGAVSPVSTLAFRLNGSVEDRFRAGTPAAIPFYRLKSLKLENAEQLNASTHVFETLKPGASIDVNAFVYAQEGSWVILAGGFFDDAVKNGDDLDRNGLISRAEQVAAYRFHRYNYRIRFKGAIMENRTAIVESSGAVTGVVADWMDKWATIDFGPGNWSGTGEAASFNNDLRYDAAAPASNPNNFPNISYTFDEDVAKGKLDDDAGFHLPITPDLTFQN